MYTRVESLSLFEPKNKPKTHLLGHSHAYLHNRIRGRQQILSLTWCYQIPNLYINETAKTIMSEDKWLSYLYKRIEADNY